MLSNILNLNMIQTYFLDLLLMNKKIITFFFTFTNTVGFYLHPARYDFYCLKMNMSTCICLITNY